MEASKEFNAYKRTIYKALKDKFLKTALERAVAAFRSNRDAALAAFPDVVEKRERLQEIKNRVIDNLDSYVGKAREALEKNHAHTYFASDAERANDIL
ncbi:MAG: hypothetical protein U9Q76_02805, partial [candidate division WOR-3 bacterium]|nr:hypothetical protein [candidate division WOR-3 bacterium]